MLWAVTATSDPLLKSYSLFFFFWHAAWRKSRNAFFVRSNNNSFSIFGLILIFTIKALYIFLFSIIHISLYWTTTWVNICSIKIIEILCNAIGSELMLPLHKSNTNVQFSSNWECSYHHRVYADCSNSREDWFFSPPKIDTKEQNSFVELKNWKKKSFKVFVL